VVPYKTEKEMLPEPLFSMSRKPPFFETHLYFRSAIIRQNLADKGPLVLSVDVEKELPYLVDGVSTPSVEEG
jgi:hypothetical protein